MLLGAIFDQDGILFDTEKLFQKSWLKAGEMMNVHVPYEFTLAICGSSGQKMLDIIHEYVPDVDPVEYRDLAFKLCFEFQDKELELKPGTVEILQFFKENNIPCAIASSTEKPRILKNLKNKNIEHYFDAIVSGQELERGKPEPDIFLEAARQLQLDPKDCYVFEDSFNGVIAGHRAGCFTIMIPDIKQPDETLEKYYDQCLESFYKVIEFIKNN